MIPAYVLFRRSRSYQDLSIEEQREAVRVWAATHDYSIVREFADDRSGLDTGRRQGFLALLQLCLNSHRREADVVLAYDVSRFSRLEPDEAAFHEHSLARAGVRVIYTHDAGANETGITGQVVKSLKRAMAHDYSVKLSQVVQRGLRAHAERGDFTGGPPPYGLRRAVDDGNQLHVLSPGRWKAKGERVSLVVDPAEAEIVRDTFEAYVQRGCGVAAIAHRLNERGVPPPTSRRQRGTAAWRKETIWAILHNPVYRGTLLYRKTGYAEIGKKRGRVTRPDADRVIVEHAFPAIISPELWDAAQAKHGARRFGSGRPWHRAYLLSALIICGRCGKKFQAHRPVGRRENPYYVCGGYVSSGASICDGLRVSMAYLDDAVLDGIQKRLERVLDRDVLRQRLEVLLDADRPDPEAIEPKQARLVAVRREINRAVAAITAGPEDLPSLRAALIRLERERESLETELAAMTARMAAPEASEQIADELIESLTRSREVLEAGEPEERKALVRAFLRGIEIRKSSRQALLSWYRLPNPDNLSVKLVAPRGNARGTVHRLLIHFEAFALAA